MSSAGMKQAMLSTLWRARRTSSVVTPLASAQFLTTGVLAELLARTFFESSGHTAYTLAEDGGTAPDWYEAAGAAQPSP